MKLKVINSSSNGNAFLLEHGDSVLLLDAGVSYKDIVKEINYEPERLVAALITHEHQDHCKAVKDLIRNGVPVVSSQGTASALDVSTMIIKTEQRIQISDWTVVAFDVKHDAQEPVGFIVKHKDTDNVICYIPDNGYTEYNPRGITDLIIECNYLDETIEQLAIEGSNFQMDHYKRLKSFHMSLNRCVKQIDLMDKKRLRNIVLAHLSDANSSETIMQETVNQKFNVSTYITSPGLEIDISSCPF